MPITVLDHTGPREKAVDALKRCFNIADCELIICAIDRKTAGKSTLLGDVSLSNLTIAMHFILGAAEELIPAALKDCGAAQAAYKKAGLDG